MLQTPAAQHGLEDSHRDSLISAFRSAVSTWSKALLRAAAGRAGGGASSSGAARDGARFRSSSTGSADNGEGGNGGRARRSTAGSVSESGTSAARGSAAVGRGGLGASGGLPAVGASVPLVEWAGELGRAAEAALQQLEKVGWDGLVGVWHLGARLGEERRLL